MHSIRLRATMVGLATAALSAAALVGASGAAAAGSPSVSVVARGLNVPKYLSFGRGGLYVAESGTGGRRCVDVVGVTGMPTSACSGATGAVVRIERSGRVRTVLRGLASVVETDTHEIQGPIAVTMAGRRPAVLMRGAFVAPTGTSSIPGPLGREFGKLVLATPRRVNTRLRTVANLAAFAERNPQPGATLGGLPGEVTYDSDAHDVVPYRGGYAFADAGANDVLWLHSGRLSVVARLPFMAETAPAGALGPGSPAMSIDAQAVPSSVAVGPDGALYVGVLRGIPSLPGTAAVYRVAPGQAPVEVVSGLSRVSDLAFDRSGRLLILEASAAGRSTTPTSPGALLRATLHAGAGAVQASSLAVPGLVDPTGLAVGPAGAVYITNRTGVPGQGEVLRVTGLG